MVESINIAYFSSWVESDREPGQLAPSDLTMLRRRADGLWSGFVESRRLKSRFGIVCLV